MGSIPTRSRLVSSDTLQRPARALGAFVIVTALVVQPLPAQERPPPAARDTAAPVVAEDTLALPEDSLALPEDTLALPEAAAVTQAATLDASAAAQQEGVQPPVTPMGAFVRSLVIPGWGQAKVDQPGRGAFYFAASSFTWFMVIKSQAELNAANNALPTDPELVDDKEGKRETWIVLAIFISLFSAVDAWVSAHLWDFEGEITPPDDGSMGVQFQYNVPVEGP